MKEIRKTTQFKKDFKRYKNDVEKVKSLWQVVSILANGGELSSDFKPHHLKGRMQQYMECHIENDYLLIWFDQEQDVIELVRLGSHADLFGHS